MPGKIEGINYEILPVNADNPTLYHREYMRQYRKIVKKYDKEYYERNKERLNAHRAELYRIKRDREKGIIIESN